MSLPATICQEQRWYAGVTDAPPGRSLGGLPARASARARWQSPESWGPQTARRQQWARGCGR
eukprot:scaffold610253_cov34-Prasinocladus_malaysianus.AAC.1